MSESVEGLGKSVGGRGIGGAVTFETKEIAEENQKISHETYKKTLTNLGINVAEQERIQAKEFRKNELLIKFISYPSVIFSSMVLFGGFAQFSRHNSKPECSPDLWLQITTTTFAFLSLVFMATKEFFKFEERKVTREKAAKSLRAFFHTIDTYRAINPRYGDRFEIIQGLKRRLETITRDNPCVAQNLSILSFSATPPPSRTSIDEITPRPRHSPHPSNSPHTSNSHHPSNSPHPSHLPRSRNSPPREKDVNVGKRDRRTAKRRGNEGSSGGVKGAKEMRHIKNETEDPEDELAEEIEGDAHSENVGSSSSLQSQSIDNIIHRQYIDNMEKSSEKLNLEYQLHRLGTV